MVKIIMNYKTTEVLVYDTFMNISTQKKNELITSLRKNRLEFFNFVNYNFAVVNS